MSDTQFTLRRAASTDIAEIAALDRSLWGDWSNPPTLYRQLIELYPELVLVAHQDGQYAGCAVGLFRAEPNDSLVLSIDIAPEFQRRGLGRLFLRRLLAELASRAKRVSAFIDPANAASQALFASEGFVLVGLERDFFGVDRDQQRWEYLVINS